MNAVLAVVVVGTGAYAVRKQAVHRRARNEAEGHKQNKHSESLGSDMPDANAPHPTNLGDVTPVYRGRPVNLQIHPPRRSTLFYDPAMSAIAADQQRGDGHMEGDYDWSKYAQRKIRPSRLRRVAPYRGISQIKFPAFVR